MAPSSSGNRPKYCQDGRAWSPSALSRKTAEAAYLAVTSLHDDGPVTAAGVADLAGRLDAAVEIGRRAAMYDAERNHRHAAQVALAATIRADHEVSHARLTDPDSELETALRRAVVAADPRGGR